MSCATSPECEIDRLLMWDDITPIRALNLCTDHSFERRVALERIEAMHKEKPRCVRYTLSRLQARMLIEERQAEAVGEENVIEFKRAKRRKKASGDDGPDPSP